MLVVSFSGNPAATIVVCYSPHNISPEEEVVEFYSDLSELVDSKPAQNVLFVCGDLNAQLGKNDMLHSFHENTNRNGQDLLDFIESFNLIPTNTYFQKPACKLWACQYRNGSKGRLTLLLSERSGLSQFLMQKHIHLLFLPFVQIIRLSVSK